MQYSARLALGPVGCTRRHSDSAMRRNGDSEVTPLFFSAAMGLDSYEGYSQILVLQIVMLAGEAFLASIHIEVSF